MLKIAALNEDSSDEESENEAVEEVTKEALEEIAMQQYAKTLELQKKGRHRDALNLLKDLLDTELLYEVQKVEKQDTTTSPLVKLKYLCYKNIASISAQLGDKEGAVEAYLEATEWDDTDITLWYRLGKISLDLKKYDLALFAFQHGIECNPRHWPCLDHLTTLLLGLGQYNECIINIYNALQLDSDYLRGKAYRKYIFTDFPHVHSYLSMLNPIYKWTPSEDSDVDEEESRKLIKEATDISEVFIQQVMETNVVNKLPVLELNKPIENLTWLSVGESIVDMHMHISEKALSHACIVKVKQPEEKSSNEELAAEAMEVDVSITKQENGEKQNGEAKSGDEIVNGNDSDKMEVDQDEKPTQEAGKTIEAKDPKKSRRRASSVRFLQQWGWCNKRTSARKKPNKAEQETLEDILKRFLPKHLKSEENGTDGNNKVKEFKSGDDSMDTMDLYKLFEEKERNAAESNSQTDNNMDETVVAYFNTEKEQTDVQAFIQKYVDSTCDIITMVDDFILTLSNFWDVVWPEGLGDIYMEANWCSRQHSDPPLSYVNEDNVLKNFIKINLIHLEVGINKLLEEDDGNGNIEIELIDLLRMLCSRTDELGDEALTLVLRYLWVKCHSLLYKGQVEFALDCLYYIIDKLQELPDQGENFSLKIVNFTKWQNITRNGCFELIKTLERNKELSTVPKLFKAGRYEDVISILQDSFKHCQSLASKQDWKGMSLDWGIQLVTLLESIWAINDTEQCFTWATICLREGLKQYTVSEQGSEESEKWSLVIVKALVCIEHILKIEGSAYLDVLSEKNITNMIQDVIQVIVLQLDESNTSQEMPLNTMVCWIILHYIFQREEDCGRMPKKENATETVDTEIPCSLMVLFMAHDHLGRRGWCSNDDGVLLTFILNTVLSRLRSPALSGIVETVSQYLEQCVLCRFGHPSKKLKSRYLVDHNVTPVKIDWEWSQLIFDLYRPEELPEFNSYRLASISGETEQLFQSMLALAPPNTDPQPHYSDVINFIEGKKSKLHHSNIELPYKMRDVYYLLADFYLKNNETVKALKYYAYDIVICRKRFDSWAGMALARGSLLETKLNSCESFRNEMEYLNRATAVEFCFKQALEIDSSHSMLWIEYGTFVYGVHSFCSRMLKQASESLSMESFEVLENRKESMLDTASKCFVKAHRQWMEECHGDDKGPQDERWLHYYMLGKISEKKSEQPHKYLDYYQKAATSLQENNATYPSRINYSNPQNLSVEALEIQYRIHASILKYIEQHENKVICIKDGKCFIDCLEKCVTGPFSKKKPTKDDKTADPEKSNETNVNESSTNQEGGGVKRSSSEVSDEADGNEAKRQKIDDEKPKDESNKENPVACDKPEVTAEEKTETAKDAIENAKGAIENEKSVDVEMQEDKENIEEKDKKTDEPQKEENKESQEEASEKKSDTGDSEPKKVVKDSDNASNTATSKDNSSSESSSDSSSSDTTSSSSSSSSTDSNSKQAPAEMSQDDITKVIQMCLNSLEDCVSRFPQHYKALYRLAHFHFYYKREKNIERCKDLMLGNFIMVNGSKLQGLFCERKNSNFFNSIWRIPASEVDRPGSFATHMSRCVLITMEILKELDDHKTLLDLSLQLQKTPEADKKYLRESERIELFQQALSLCIRSIKGQLNKLGKIDRTNPEKGEIGDFMIDLYKSFQKIQKNLPTKIPVFSGLLTDCYRIYSGRSDAENMIDKCIKKCQSLIVAKKQQQNAQSQPPPPPPVVSKVETPVTTSVPVVTTSTPTTPTVTAPPPIKKSKPAVSIIPATSFLPHADAPMPYKATNPFLNYLPMMDRNMLLALSSYDPATAAMYLSNLSSLTGIPPSAFQPDMIRQLMTSLDPLSQFAKPNQSQSSSSSKPKQQQSTSTTKASMEKAGVNLNTNKQSSSKPSVSTTPSSATNTSSHVSSFQKVGQAQQTSHADSSHISNNPTTVTQANIAKSINQTSSTSTPYSTTISSSTPKPAHQTVANNSNNQSPSASVKNVHQPSSNFGNMKSTSSSGNTKAVQQSSTSNINKTAYQSSGNSSVNKPTQQVPQNTGSSSKSSSQQPSQNVGGNKSTHQSSSSNSSAKSSTNTSSNTKSAHHSSTNSSNRPSHQSTKSTHHSSSSSSASGKSTHHSSSSNSNKSTHQSSPNISNSSKSLHQSSPNVSNSSKSSHQSSPNISNNSKSTHQPSQNIGNSGKSTHQSSPSVSNSGKSSLTPLPNISSSVKTTPQPSPNVSNSGKSINQSNSGKSSLTPLPNISSSVKTTPQPSPNVSNSGKSINQPSPSISNSGKPIPHQSSQSSNSSKTSHNSPTVKSSHQSTPNVSNVKSNYQSSSSNSSKSNYNTSHTSANIKPVHQSSSSSNMTPKSAHQSSSIIGSTVKHANPATNLKAAHQSSSSKSSHHSTSSNIKSGQQPNPNIKSHQGEISVNTNLYPKSSPSPHQISPKTLQEKLAERQKQNPSVSSSNRPSSSSSDQPRKSSSSSSINVNKSGSSKDHYQRSVSDLNSPRATKDNSGSNRQSSSNRTDNRPIQPKKVIDPNEIIILDDD